MAYDPRLAELLRGDLAGLPVTEVRMFGGLCFMVGGHMTCGVMKDGGMFRVGKGAEAAALLVEGVRPMDFTGRAMPGLVEVTDEVLDDRERRAAVLALALGFVRGLPPKVAKPAKPR